MPTIAAWIKIDGENAGRALHDVCEKLDGAEGEIVLDLSAVRRIDASGIRALEELVTVAEEKTTKVVLRGVNIDVYKVLKLVRLTPRFSFRGQ